MRQSVGGASVGRASWRHDGRQTDGAGRTAAFRLAFHRAFHRPWPLALGFALLASACSFRQDHGYVQSDDGSLSFRYPAEWHDIGLEPQGAEWIAGIDASVVTPEPDPGLLRSDPYVVARVLPLRAEPRDEITLRSLRLFALPDQRDPVTSTDDDLRLVFHRDVVDDNGFEGHHMRFEIDVDGKVAVQEHLAVFDPARQRIQQLTIVCSAACFQTNEVDIDDVFGSVRYRP